MSNKTRTVSEIKAEIKDRQQAYLDKQSKRLFKWIVRSEDLDTALHIEWLRGYLQAKLDENERKKSVERRK
jgi:hypothetical protein